MISRDATDFVDRLAALRFPAAFNPYSDFCSDHDLPDAAATRRRNLEIVLSQALTKGVDSLWVARDLGYRGGRRTGLALTDDVTIGSHARMWQVDGLRRSTRGPPMPERTAALIWHVLSAVHQPVFLWNVFPLHPHEPDDPLSNRCHTRREREIAAPLLVWLLDMLRPKHLIAIGRDAQAALADLSYSTHPVRHPSYGGQVDFVRQSAAVYGIKIEASPKDRRSEPELAFI
jgi:uracil-DNA glycosylase